MLTSNSILAQTGGMGAAMIALLVIVVLAVLIFGAFAMRFLGLWIQAVVSKAPVSFLSLIGMWFRKVNPRVIVLSRIQAVKAGLNITSDQLETHYLARGNVPRVVNALIAADRAKIDLAWDTACAIDLAGRDMPRRRADVGESEGHRLPARQRRTQHH